MTAATRWAEALEAWAIPEHILSAAPESPWGFPPHVFAAATDDSLAGPPSPTHRRALDVLPDGGVVLDVGCGAGAASLPLAPPASRIIAVDESAGMLEQLRALAAGRVDVDAIEGRWPDVAANVGTADVAVCAHVAYNVADLHPFVAALTSHARRRVVLELTAVHPQSPLSPLWWHFWHLPRPTAPTADDARAVVEECVGGPVQAERWTRRPPSHRREPAEMVAWIRRRLCLPASADAELAGLLGPAPDLIPSDLVTLWWPGGA